MRIEEKSNMRIQKAIEIHVAFLFSFKKYEQGIKHEAWGAHLTLKFPL